MYGVEALRGRPLRERTQEMAFRFGLAMVLCLMVFVTWNDLSVRKDRIVQFVSDIFS
jgi:regulator of sigma E protease